MRTLLVMLIITAACGDNATSAEPDAGITAEPPSESPPVACLPWPCGSVDAAAPDAGPVVGRDPQEGGASVPPWHLDAGLDAP